MINIIIPMAGSGSRFKEAGYDKPKPFIDILGKPMITRVIENLDVKNAKYILIARKEHIESEKELVKEIEQKYNATFITVNKLTEGAACTILYAHKLINSDTPLLLANSDQIVDISIQDYINGAIDRNLNGSILTFKDNHPKWSYAKINSKGIVTEVKEKVPISDNATVGIYYFVRGSIFVEAAIDMIINNDRVNNEFYTCPVYNYAIKNGAKVGIYNIPNTSMHGTGTPEDLQKYIDILKSRN